MTKDQLIYLMQKYGRNSLSGFLLNGKMSYYPFSCIEGIAGYVQASKIIAFFGEPLCAENDYFAAIEELVNFSASEKKSCLFLMVGEVFLRHSLKFRDCSYLKIGDDFIFNVQTYVPKGNKLSVVRTPANFARKQGVIVKEYNLNHSRDLKLENEFIQVAKRWLRTFSRFRASLMELNDGEKIFENREIKRYFYAELNGKVTAIMTCLPIYGRDGYFFDHTIRDVDAPNGVVELMTLEMIRIFKGEGRKAATFGISPLLDLTTIHNLSGFAHLLVRLANSISERLFHMQNLYHFRKKFRTNISETLYLIKYPVGLGVYESLNIFKIFNSF
jgi:lysylphosphatidylglycerol synthetase-like protein (DUF2156 family)